MKRLKYFVLALAMAVNLTGFAPVVVSATNNDDPCSIARGDKPDFCNKTPGGEKEVYSTVRTVLNVVYFWLGVVAVIFVIIGGVNLMTSQGDPGRVAKARNTIIYALVGLLITLLAFAITQFVLNALKGNVA